MANPSFAEDRHSRAFNEFFKKAQDLRNEGKLNSKTLNEVENKTFVKSQVEAVNKRADEIKSQAKKQRAKSPEKTTGTAQPGIKPATKTPAKTAFDSPTSAPQRSKRAPVEYAKPQPLPSTAVPGTAEAEIRFEGSSKNKNKP